MLSSCSLIIAHFDVSVTGDIRLDLMLVSFVIWAMIRTKPELVGPSSERAWPLCVLLCLFLKSPSNFRTALHEWIRVQNFLKTKKLFFINVKKRIEFKKIGGDVFCIFKSGDQ